MVEKGKGKLQVVNARDLGLDWEEDDSYIYIGRGTMYGNKYRIGVHGCRTKVVHKYQDYLKSRLTRDESLRLNLEAIANRVRNGETITLVCHCKPQLCHGDVLMLTIMDMVDGK
jgi:hypothetical protein